MNTPNPQTAATSLDKLLQSTSLPVAVYDRGFAHVYGNAAFQAFSGAERMPLDMTSLADYRGVIPSPLAQKEFFENLEPYVEQRLDGSAHGFPVCASDGQVYLVEMLAPTSRSKSIEGKTASTITSPCGIKLDTFCAAWVAAQLSAPGTELAPPMDLRGRVEHIEGLPCLPAVAQRILSMSGDASVGAEELARVIELDPLLATQLLRWASSPFYGRRGKIESVSEAVKLLGFDMVFNSALGVATLQTLRVPRDGVLGVQHLWRHALFSATLMGKLALRVSATPRPGAGLAYLTGLMHNIGLFLLGHQFPREFDFLSRLKAANPGTPIAKLEKFAFGTDHARLGTWLLSLWGLPDDVRVAVAHHHNADYRGNMRNLVALTTVADQALAGLGIGEAVPSEDALQAACTTLGIATTVVAQTLEAVMDSGADLEAFIRQTLQA